MFSMNRYEARVEGIVAALRRDGLDFWAERLRRSKQGIFSGTQLGLVWRSHLVRIVDLPSISDHTRVETQRLLADFDKELGGNRDGSPDDCNSN
jgi:hypothetical protein